MSPEDRALLESDGLRLFETLLEEGGIADDDPRITPGGREDPAFALLTRLGLVRRDAERWVAEDPTHVQSQVVSPLSAEGARLLEESSHWSRAFGSLAQAWRRAPRASDGGPFVYLRGPAIAAYIEGLMVEVETEVLTAQPQTGRDLGRGLTNALTVERELLGRGVRILTLYQHASRRSVATREYVSALTALGAEVRTLDEFFNRMIVVDRRVAIIPSPDDLGTALAVLEPTVVAYLVDIFERSWSRARAFTSGDATDLKEIAAEQRAMTIRMLIEGHSDPASAKRLGVSPRTYAGYIADLKDEFEAETRFQLGYLLGQRGISDSGDAPG